MPAERHRVGPAAEIPKDGCRLVAVDGMEVGVFDVHGTLRAYVSRCAHQGGPVCRGDVMPRTEELIGAGGVSLGVRASASRLDVACPWHGWEYDLETGENIADRRFRLRAVPVVVEEGVVYLEVKR